MRVPATSIGAAVLPLKAGVPVTVVPLAFGLRWVSPR